MSIRTKTLTILLSMAAMASASATLLGLNGTHRTYSAQSLGHSALVFGVSGMGSYDDKKLENGAVVRYNVAYDTLLGREVDRPDDTTKITEIFDLTTRVFMSMGFSNYFDLGVSLPVYSDWLTGYTLELNPDLKRITDNPVGIGDLEIAGKLQYPPYEHDPSYEMAFMGIVTVPTGSKTAGFIPKQLWYIPKVNKGDSTQGTHFFTADAMTLALLMLNTIDFSQIDRTLKLKWNLNFGIQTTSNPNLDNSFLLSSSVEWKPSGDLFGLFLEFSGITRMSNFANGFKLGDDPLFLTPGFTIDAENGVSLSLALDVSLTQGKNLAQLRIDPNPGPRQNDALCPKCQGDGQYSAYKVRPAAPLGASATLSWKGFMVPRDQDKDGYPDDQDACPSEWGPPNGNGCPDFDGDEDGVPDLQDKCPKIPQGKDGKDGCPNPDSDGDGICDPWVATNDMQSMFSDVCRGIDQCPKLAQGANGKDGCPDPDTDKDSICDPWVAKLGMSAKYAGICKATDLCPTVPQGVGGINGCPNPDTDKDSICDPWVAEAGLSPQFAKICHGSDLCPTVPQGPGGANGCPSVDTDKDGWCDPWVAEKGLLDKFTAVCHGIDFCPTEPLIGPDGANGCPNKAPVVIEKVVERVVEKRDTVVQKDTVVKKDTVVRKDTVVVQIEKKAAIVLHGVNFTTGSADLTPESFSKLDEVANTLKRSPDIILEIRGHTDDKGSEKKNKQLSQDRADAVCRYLVSQGVPPKQLKSTGYGSKMPVASNKTADGREKNRRIEMYRVQ